MKLEQQLIVAINRDQSHEQLLDLARQGTIDLVSQWESSASLLFHIIKKQRWKVLFDLLVSSSVRLDNLGCLTSTRQTLQGMQAQPEILQSVATTSSHSNGFANKHVWRHGIFPQLPLRSQGQLSQVCRQFSHYCPEIQELRREFPTQFEELKKSGKPINVLQELDRLRQIAYPSNESGANLSLVFRAIALNDLATLITATSATEFAASPAWLTQSRKVDFCDTNAFAYQNDNLAVLIYLFSLHPSFASLESACRHGSTQWIKLFLLADPTHQLIDIEQCLAYACSQGHTGIVDLLAPLISNDIMTQFMDLAIRIPNAKEMVKIFLQHGAKIRVESIKQYGVEIESPFAFARANNLTEVLEVLNRYSENAQESVFISTIPTLC